MISEIKALQVAAGKSHSIILDLNNNVWTFGRNNEGQLGLDDTTNRLIPTLIPHLKAKWIAAGGNHSIIIDLEDNVWSFGINEYGQLGLGSDLRAMILLIG